MSETQTPDVIVTTSEGAAILGVAVQTLTRWLSEGRIKPLRKADGRGRANLYRLADLERVQAAINTPIPEGYVSIAEGARLCRITEGSMRSRIVRHPKRYPVRVHRYQGMQRMCVLASACVPSESTGQPTSREAEPVLYGLLTGDDARILEQRRQRQATAVA